MVYKPHANPESSSLMYEVKKQRQVGTGEVVGEVMKLTSICDSIQLIPKCGAKPINTSWTSSTILDVCESFYIDNMGSLCTYQSVY